MNLLNQCQIRLYGENEWSEIKEFYPVAKSVLIETWLEEHPEFYERSVLSDGYKELIIETRHNDSEDSTIQIYKVDISYKFDIKDL
ncbi:MAG: hypothetical protein ACI4V7_06120 [Succinivibrionaceae bacterium]